MLVDMLVANSTLLGASEEHRLDWGFAGERVTKSTLGGWLGGI